jgi:large subunit ribosomal protein L17
MRHRLEGKKFGREIAHRTAMFNNLVKSMIISPKGRIETTEAKAKSLRSVVERLITYAKKDSIASRRQAYSVIGNRSIVKKLFDEIGPLMMDRNGGYTRVLKTGYRKGDSAPMAIIEFVGMEAKHEEAKQEEAKKAKTTKKSTPRKATAPKKAKPEVKKAAAPKKAAEPKKPAAPKKEKLENIKAADLTK